MKRRFPRTAFRVVSVPCLLWAVLSGASLEKKPGGDPLDYPANVGNGRITLAARLATRKELWKAFKDPLFPNDRFDKLYRDFTVVKAAVYPSDRKPLAVAAQEFRFLSGNRPVVAMSAEDVAFELIHGRPRSLGRDGDIIIPGGSGENRDKKQARAKLHESAIGAALLLSGLPPDSMSGSRAGYLYFPARRKEWKGADSLAIQYGSDGSVLRLILPVTR